MLVSKPSFVVALAAMTVLARLVPEESSLARLSSSLPCGANCIEDTMSTFPSSEMQTTIQGPLLTLAMNRALVSKSIVPVSLVLAGSDSLVAPVVRRTAGGVAAGETTAPYPNSTAAAFATASTKPSNAYPVPTPAVPVLPGMKQAEYPLIR